MCYINVYIFRLKREEEKNCGRNSQWELEVPSSINLKLSKYWDHIKYIVSSSSMSVQDLICPLIKQDPMFMIIHLRLFLTAVTPTAVKPTVVIL